MSMYKVTARIEESLISVVVNELNIYNAVVEGSRKLKCTYKEIIKVEIV